MMTFGQFLRYARQSAGMSQRELAQLLGVSNGYLSDVENDRRRPLNTGRLLKAARRLGISLLAATKQKGRGDGFFELHAWEPDEVLRVGALLYLAWDHLSQADFELFEARCRAALSRAGIDPEQPPEER